MTGILTVTPREVDCCIEADTIRYEITGSVGVTLHYGSGADAATIEENFPFTCTTAASTAEPLKLLSEHTEMKVDTSSWHGEVDEGDGAKARD